MQPVFLIQLNIYLLSLCLACCTTPMSPQGKHTTIPNAETILDTRWTPPPAQGDVPAWEKETKEDWNDLRFNNMDTGPYLAATIRVKAGGKRILTRKGLAIRLGEKHDATFLFDRNLMRATAGWIGGQLQHSASRFGLINTPTPQGSIQFYTHESPGWAYDNSFTDPRPSPHVPLPPNWARYQGVYLHGKHVILSYTIGSTDVLEMPDVESLGNIRSITRTIEINHAPRPMGVLLYQVPESKPTITQIDGVTLAVLDSGNTLTAAGVLNNKTQLHFQVNHESQVFLQIPAQQNAIQFKVLIWNGNRSDLHQFVELIKVSESPQPLSPLTKGGGSRWVQEPVTQGTVGQDTGAYVVDTLQLPYENPYNALMFMSGLDFLPNGDLAVCTVHGDVWLVRGIDETLQALTWKRYATGMYQPLGLKVIKGHIHVLERGQLTRLHDLNNDDEADFYENVSNEWGTTGEPHAYDTCLETDAQGRFYFFKTGAGHTPTGGCLLQLAPNTRTPKVFATGFRHANGLSIGPDGTITGSDQEGNWIPATRIDMYHKGGFYGHMLTHHRPKKPTTFDPPVCWLPRQMDNSAGGQVWVPDDQWGPLAGHLLHLSFGRCQLMLVLHETVGGQIQGGVVRVGATFLAGAMRGRFSPKDGQLYVCGSDGWLTAAKADGCLQRVRYTGRDTKLPTALKIHANGIRITFSNPLNQSQAENITNYKIEQWNYRWTGRYGSKEWSVIDPEMEGRDPVAIRTARLLDDQHTVFLQIDDVKPVMQMRIRYDLWAKDGDPVKNELFNTINKIGVPFTGQ